MNSYYNSILYSFTVKALQELEYDANFVAHGIWPH